MFNHVEFRSVIRFLVLRKTEKKQIILQVQEAYGSIYNWIQEFSSGGQCIFDSSSSGRPPEIGENIINKMKKIVSANKKVTQTELFMQLNVSKITIQRLLAQLRIRKLYSRFVPKFLTAGMMVRRFNACKHNISLMDKIGPRFLENIVTVDETPLSLYIPFSRRESKEWVLPGQKPANVIRHGTTYKKIVTLIIFWGVKTILSYKVL